jgi:hypothetical protein
MLTKQQAVTQLSEIGSHGAVYGDEARAIAAAFGITVRIPTVKANTDPKGYLNPSMKKGQKVQVLSGCQLVEALAYPLGFRPERDYLGRGPRFRDALAFLRQKV